MGKALITFFVFISVIIFCFAFKPSKSPEYYYQRGEEKFNEKDFYKAIVFYTKAIKLSPNYIDAFWKRGLSYSRIDSSFSAVKDFTKVIDTRPNGDVYTERGRARFHMKDTINACSDWSMGCELMSNRACDLKRKICN